MLNRNRTKASAFSLIEISVVILIIGVIIAGVVSSTILVKKSRITSAQALTSSSPVNNIQDLSFWLESSLDKSFEDSQSSDGAPLTSWYDIKQLGTKTNATVPAGSDSPTYSNTIKTIFTL